MQRIVEIYLTDSERNFRLHEDAYDVLSKYLKDARARAGDDPEADDVIEDVEGLIGDRLAVLAGPDNRVLSADDINSVISELEK